MPAAYRAAYIRWSISVLKINLADSECTWEAGSFLAHICANHAIPSDFLHTELVDRPSHVGLFTGRKLRLTLLPGTVFSIAFY